ncbi:MAG: TIGR00730 family Rossman fold protein, partial [Candidatus Latescibacterota bacterium]
ECGGKITGVIPLTLKELGYAYEQADQIIVTDGLRERKAVMEERADGFLGLPGGYGTLEEMIEIITLKQLNMHTKPIVFLNINSFFNGLLNQFETGYREGFISDECRRLYLVTDSIEEALEHLKKGI